MKPRLCLLSLVIATAPLHASDVFQSQRHDFEVEVVNDSLNYPWSVAFLPDGGYLVTERPGYVTRIDAGGHATRLDGAPDVSATGQGGLLDVRLDPEHARNRRVFFCYAAGDLSGYGTELASAELDGGRFENLRTLFVARPKVHGGRHFGCRIAFGGDGHLYLSLGDRGARGNAQDLGTHHGGVVRLRLDGSTPADNPFVERAGARPEIFAYGIRNPQAMAVRPGTGDLWEVEHGPQGGDEVNIVRAGRNYGWPVVSFGAEYGSGIPVGEGMHKPGMVDPVYYWDPSIAPSGMAFYDGDAFPHWKGDLFVGALKFRLLARLELDGDTVVAEERLLQRAIGRIRDVRVGPDGLIYLLTDENPGKLVRLKPAG